MKKLIAFLMPLLILSACSNSDPNPDPDPNDPEVPSYPENDKDLNPDLNTWEATVTVTFNESSVKVEGTTDAQVQSSISGSNVDLALGAEKLIKVVVTGSSSNGSLRLSGDRKHLIELRNLTLTSTDRPAINDQNSKRAFLMLTGENKLSDGEVYASAAEDRKGCYFAESHIVVCGDGSLDVEGNYRHGFVTDGFLYVNPGVKIKATSSKKNAIHVKGSGSVNNAYRGIEIAGGTITALSTADNGKAMRCDGKIIISGGKVNLACTGNAAIDPDDGLLGSPAGIKSDLSVSMSDKAIVKIDGSGKGAKGITADQDINVNGGSLEITLSGEAYSLSGDSSTPKGINAGRNLTVADGIISVSATGSGSVAIEADAATSFTGGSITAFGADWGLKTPAASATGGKILIAGSNSNTLDGAETKSFSSVLKGEETEVGSTVFTWPLTLTSATILYYGL